MDRIISNLISITCGAVLFLFLGMNIMSYPIERYNGYEDLYEQALTFNKEYTGNDSKEALQKTLKMADDYTKDGSIFKVSFEQDDKYLILEYNENKDLVNVSKNDGDGFKSFLLIASAMLSIFIAIIIKVGLCREK